MTVGDLLLIVFVVVAMGGIIHYFNVVENCYSQKPSVDKYRKESDRIGGGGKSDKRC